jgi:hypothetical protein
VLAKIFRMLPLILADLDMRANELFGTQALSMLTSNEMFINVLFTPEEKTFQYRVTSAASRRSRPLQNTDWKKSWRQRWISCVR